MYSLGWMMGMAEMGNVHRPVSSSWAKYTAERLISLTSVNEQTTA